MGRGCGGWLGGGGGGGGGGEIDGGAGVGGGGGGGGESLQVGMSANLPHTKFPLYHKL